MTAAARPRRLAPSPLFASGALAFFLLGMLPALYGVSLPAWTAAFGLAEGQAGTLLAVYHAGAVATVLAGVAGVPGLTLRLGAALVALGAAGLALGNAWALLLVCAALAGLGFGILAVAVNRRFLHEFGPRGASMVALVNGIYGLGAILAPLLFLLARGTPAPVLWAAAALAALASALARPEPRRVAATGLPPPSRLLGLLLLLNFAAVILETSLIGYGASALQDLGHSAASAARLVSAFFLAFVAGRLGLALLSHRLRPDLVFLGGLGGAALCLGLATVAPAWGFVPAGACVGICFPAFFVWSARLLGPDPRIGAAILAAGLSGGTLGPLALRPILGTVGEEALFWILFTFAALLTALVAALRSRLRPA